jgi:hypothetical protein
MTTAQPDDVDALAAALRADATDLDIYARVLTEALEDALPAGMVAVDRDRSLADRLAGRPGRVSGIRISAGDWELSLAASRTHGVTAHVRQLVRGVAISNREVEVEEWTRLLARALAQRAEESNAARQALARLLGQG